MKRKTKIVATLALYMLVACLCACAPSSGRGDEQTATTSSSAAPGSLKAIHTEDQWGAIQANPTKKTCLGCHSRDSIVAATANFEGIEGLNPHASHTESYDCMKCHSMEGTNVLVCNTACHGGYHGDGEGWPLPNENWANPSDELPAADGVAIPNNV